MFYLFLSAHLIADFILQPYWLVKRKRQWDGLLIHGGLVLVMMLLLPIIEPTALALWPVMLGITAVHIAADWWKVNRADRLVKSPILGFLLDQVIHVVTIVVGLSLALPAAMVWSLQAPAAWVALLISGYIIAGFATPIGVMVWLDPQFKHVALAVQARMRGFITGVAVVSLTLFGGLLALPATLTGYLIVANRQHASPHPLDSRIGLLTTILISSLVGTVLALTR